MLVNLDVRNAVKAKVLFDESRVFGTSKDDDKVGVLFDVRHGDFPDLVLIEAF